MARNLQAYMKRCANAVLGALLGITMFTSSTTEARADSYCYAVPAEVYTTNEGMVVVWTASRSDFVGVCNVRTAWKGVDPAVCWNWFSTVSNAVLQHKMLGLYYIGLAENSCASIATYANSPAPYYVRMAG